jgi:phage terminase large subunit GpA-like protein
MPKGRRNEALDCRVYGLAALHILNPNLDRLAKDQERERLKNHHTSEKAEVTPTNEWMGYEDWNFN